jgi:hypothetical protein
MKHIALALGFMATMATAKAQDTLSVLFIGNSFTFMNEMPIMFKEIAASKGKTVHVEYFTEGGKSLEYHSTQEKTYKAIKSRKWDYVVLQELSNTPAQPDSKTEKISLPFFKQLADSVRNNCDCTQIMLYMTWGYKNGNSQWSEINTYETMQARITNTYMRYTDLLQAQVAPVGMVWSQFRTSYPAIELYDPDNFHPSKLGSYLSASTFYAAIFGESPYGALYYAGLDPYTAEMIQLTASQVVLNNLNQWRLVYNNNKLTPAFDVTIKNGQVKFENRSDGYTEIEWDFGNGVVSREVNPTVRLPKGKYTVKLTVKNNCKSRVLFRNIIID